MVFGPDFLMSPMLRSGSMKLVFLFVSAFVGLPVLVSWGGGVANPWLDVIAIPGVVLVGLPASLGLWAWFALLLLSMSHGLGVGRAALRGWAPLSAEFLLSLGALSLLASASAAARPLPWIAVGAALLRRWQVQIASTPPPHSGSRRMDPQTSRAVRSWFLLGWLAWGLAMRAQPFGDGVLPGSWEDRLATVVAGIPISLLELLIAGVYATLAVVLARASRPNMSALVVGAVVAVGLESTFGTLGHYWLSAAFLGALLAAWPISLFGSLRAPLRPALLLVAICGLAQLRPVLLERWNCSAADDQQGLRFLLQDDDLSSLAVIPDNMPFLVLLADGGQTLLRMAPAGVVSESRALDVSGGWLVSPPTGTRIFARVVASPSSLHLEWWDTAELRLVASRTLDVSCGGREGFVEPGSHRLWLTCPLSGDLLAVSPQSDGPVQRMGLGEVPGRASPLGGSFLVDRRGVLARVDVMTGAGESLASVPLGPWAAGVSQAGPLFAVGRGPAGHLQVRGRPLGPGGREPVLVDTPEGASAALGDLLDSVRVPTWPGRPLPIGDAPSVYVTSPVDGRATRVDLEVPWHQVSVALGSPVRQAVVDGGSETLYGVNRCGLFELRISSTFPWRDLGHKAPPLPTPGSAEPSTPSLPIVEPSSQPVSP